MSTLSPQPPLSPPPSPSRKKSPFKPILITILCGVLFAAGSCVGFLNTLNLNGPSNPATPYLAVGFYVGVALLLGGSVWAVVAFVKYLFGFGRETQ